MISKSSKDLIQKEKKPSEVGNGGDSEHRLELDIELWKPRLMARLLEEQAQRHRRRRPQGITENCYTQVMRTEKEQM